jgi:hypothetical protein
MGRTGDGKDWMIGGRRKGSAGSLQVLSITVTTQSCSSTVRGLATNSHLRSSNCGPAEDVLPLSFVHLENLSR